MHIKRIVNTTTKKLLLNEYGIGIINDFNADFDNVDVEDRTKIVCIAFNGSENFILALHAEELALKKIAFSFTGDDDMYDDEVGIESLKEFINIVAGHILGEFSNLHNIDSIGISTPFIFSNDLLTLYKKHEKTIFDSKFGLLKLFYFH